MWKVLLALFVGATIYKAVQPATPSPAPAGVPALAAATPLASEATKSWKYRVSKDAMTDAKVMVASLDAVSMLSLDFPYAGRNQPRLALRSNGKQLDVLVAIDKGQILCPLRSCSIAVRFDDDKPTRFTGSGPTDRSTTVVFLTPEKRFLERLRRSKKLLIELDIFRQGTHRLVFETGNLDWPPK